MRREAIGRAETVLLAQEEACKALGVQTHEAEFEILQMPVKKTFGLFGGKLAEVKAFISNDPKVISEKYIRSILDHMNITSYDIEKVEKDDGIEFNIIGDNVGSIIGRRGEVLDAIQYLSCLVANNYQDGDSYYKVNVNIGDYREKRKKTLESLGTRMAKKSLKYRKNFSLEPMNPYERRIIHTSVQNIDGVTSWSVGEDLDRHVVIGMNKNDKVFRKNKNNYHKNNYKKFSDKGNHPNNIDCAPLYGKIN